MSNLNMFAKYFSMYNTYQATILGNQFFRSTDKAPWIVFDGLDNHQTIINFTEILSDLYENNNLYYPNVLIISSEYHSDLDDLASTISVDKLAQEGTRFIILDNTDRLNYFTSILEQLGMDIVKVFKSERLKNYYVRFPLLKKIL